VKSTDALPPFLSTSSVEEVVLLPLLIPVKSDIKEEANAAKFDNPEKNSSLVMEPFLCCFERYLFILLYCIINAACPSMGSTLCAVHGISTMELSEQILLWKLTT
jgi:hypothetical protein